jgi:hypothetical protein
VAIGAEAVAAPIEALRNQGLEVDLVIGHPGWRSQARVVIVGEEGVSYGAPPTGGGSWKRALLQELSGQLDLSRICACHVYLTDPFVLSWSLLEAMAHTIAAVLADPPRFRPLGQAARQTVVERYDLATICLPAQLALVDGLAAGRPPTGRAL